MPRLFIAKTSGRYRRSLRRYALGSENPCPVNGYHNAEVIIGVVDEAEHEHLHGDNWPHDDPRWPATCPHCGYVFAETDGWQRNDDALYETSFPLPPQAFTIQEAPVGACIPAPWAFSPESWRIQLPRGFSWITDQPASDGEHWTVEGEMPDITVAPSIWCSPPDGWHGFIRGGEIIDV